MEGDRLLKICWNETSGAWLFQDCSVDFTSVAGMLDTFDVQNLTFGYL